MADVLTQTLRLTEPAVGGDAATWGSLLNSDLDYIDAGVNQSVQVVVNDTNAALVADGSSGDQARYQRYVIQGAWTATRTITIPAAVQKIGSIVNGTSGGFDVILTTGSGTTLQVPPGGDLGFRCDGTNVFPRSGISNLGVRGFSGAPIQYFSLPTSYRSFKIIAQNLVTVANATLYAQVSTNSGVSFITSGYGFNGINVAASSIGANPGNSQSGILLTSTLPGSTTQPWSLEMSVYPGSAGLTPNIIGNGFGFDSTGLYHYYSFGGSVAAPGPVNYLAILTANLATNFSGLITVLGVF